MPVSQLQLSKSGDQTGLDRCPVCGASEAQPRFRVPFPHQHTSGRQGFSLTEQIEVPSWTISKCARCSLQFAHPRPTKDDIIDFYASQEEPNDWELEHYLNSQPDRLTGFSKLAEAISALPGKPRRLLEVGCAGGWFLDAARARGWEVQGVEASPKFQKFATTELGLPVVLGTLDDLKKDLRGSFDVIAMFDVLEHLQDPVADLQKMREYLAPNGHIVIATCDIGSFCARLYGIKWRQVVVSHTVYWTKKSMKMALSAAGLRLVQFSEPRYWHPNWVQHSRNKAKEICKFAARVLLNALYVPLSRWQPIRDMPAMLTAGKIDHANFMYKIGDQPVLNDVMLVVAKLQ